MTWPTEQQRGQDPAWVRRTPRPTALSHPYEIPPLADVQAIWDEADRRLRDHEQYLAEQETAREQRERAAAAEREQAYAAQEAKRAEAQETLLRAQYVSAGGSEQGWQRDRERVLSDAAVSAMQAQQGRGGALISKAGALG